MNRKSVSSILVLAQVLAVLALVASCDKEDSTLNFDIMRGLSVDATDTSVNSVLLVDDLAKDSDVQSFKSGIKSIDLTMDAKVTSVGTDNKATTLTGKLALRPKAGATDGSQDVLIGQVDKLPLTSGSSLSLPSNAALNTFLVDTVKGEGSFQVVLVGNSDAGPTKFAYDVNLHLLITY